MSEFKFDYKPNGEYDQIARDYKQTYATPAERMEWEHQFAEAAVFLGLTGGLIENVLAVLYSNPLADPVLIDKAAKAFSKALTRLDDSMGGGL